MSFPINSDSSSFPNSITLVAYHRRILIITLFLSFSAFLIVVASVGAFFYVTRKENLLRKCHLFSVVAIVVFELTFLISIVLCSTFSSKNIQGQILTILLVIGSFLSLMLIIYFLLEDILKERVEPLIEMVIPSKCETIEEIRTISRHVSPIPSISSRVDQIETIEQPTEINEEKPTEIEAEIRVETPPPVETIVENIPTVTIVEEKVDRIREDLLAAIEERTIPALESAIEQVKENDRVQDLRYEFERALELLHRLVKIEHMKIKVLRLNQSTIAELHSYIKPPDEVSTVMRATFLLLGHSDREIQDWQQIQCLLGRFGRESVRRRCYELNPLSIPVDKAREAKDILRNYDLIRVSEISVGLSAFYCWSTTMIEEREKLLESQRRIVR